MHLSCTYDRQLRGQIRFVFRLLQSWAGNRLSRLNNNSRQAWAGEPPCVHKKLSTLGRLGLERRCYLYSYYTDRKYVRDWSGVSDVLTYVIF